MTTLVEQTRQYIPLSDRVLQAEELARENGGLLPRFTRLMKSNKALAQAVSRNKQAFEHIPREANVNFRLTDHVANAEKIAAENGGRLPAYTDLMQTHPRLAGVVRDHPEAFAHLERSRTINQEQLLRERVAEAERLAAANGGVLECTAAFQRKHNKLVLHIRRHPEAFEHIPRLRRVTTSLAEHIKHAEQLAEQNTGLLPPSGVLRRTHPSLDEAIRKHRADFAHIKRAGKLRTGRGEFGTYVAEAERLAAVNGGILPHAGALRKLNNNLLSTIYRHPALFLHIPREVRNGSGRVVSIRQQETKDGSL